MTVTLETLRADFERAYRAELVADDEEDGFYEAEQAEQMREQLIRAGARAYLRAHALVQRMSDKKPFLFDVEDELGDQTLRAANILDVAEKHGLEAAMLYKLSDGAIDPRVQP